MYELINDTQMTHCRAATAERAETELTLIPKWQAIEPELTISGVDRLPFAYLRCPRDNRRDVKRYGVPITYGVEKDVEELDEHIRIDNRE